LQLVVALEFLPHLEVVVEHDVEGDPAEDNETNRNYLSTFLQDNLVVVVVKNATPRVPVSKESQHLRIVLQTIVPPAGVFVGRHVILVSGLPGFMEVRV
jgi:hypothetical protein